MLSRGMSKNEISLWGICIFRSGRMIMAIESSEQPRMTANSLIRGHSSYSLNLKTWYWVSQKVVAICRKEVSIFKYWRDRSDLIWKGCSLFQSFPLRLLRKVFINWREAWVMINLRGRMKTTSPQGPLLCRENKRLLQKPIWEKKRSFLSFTNPAVYSGDSTGDKRYWFFLCSLELFY